MLWPELGVVLLSLTIIAALYSSVGHGGGSGYLAILSLTVIAVSDPLWLKQYAWSLNLIVAGIAFWHYSGRGHLDRGFVAPFLIGSVPMAALGGYVQLEGSVYGVLLSLVLVFAAWRLMWSSVEEKEISRPSSFTAVVSGGGIGLASGMIGIGGGIFLSPLLMLSGWANAKETAATSALFIWMNSLSGLLGSSLSSGFGIDVDLFAPFAGAVLIGGLLGSRYGSEVSSQAGIRRLLVAILLIAAAKRISVVMGI
tara:strand:+ start:1079 stop:1840 length:762 start_codon:yes stop_codon:yes gene_type:complete